jgi:hypothetical protein
MQLYIVHLYLETALHVSGGTTTHHQERKQMYLKYLVFVTPLMLPAAITADSRCHSSFHEVFLFCKILNLGLIFAPYFGFVAKGALSITNTPGAVFELSISPAVTQTGLRNLRRQIYCKKLHAIRESYLYAQDGKFRILSWFSTPRLNVYLL